MPSQRTTHLMPASLGAAFSRGAREDLFVAGFAIEDFLCRSARAESWQPDPIRVASHPTEAVAYLEQQVATVDPTGGRQTFARNALSPFETRHPSAPLSVLSATASLGNEPLDEFAAWWATRGSSRAFMLYSVDVATRGGEWPRCLRWLSEEPGKLEPAGEALLLVRSGPLHEDPALTEIMIHSSTPVWLHDSVAFGASIDRTAADENLARLATLCATFANHPGLAGATLAIAGREFLGQETRLRGTLERTLDRELPPPY